VEMQKLLDPEGTDARPRSFFSANTSSNGSSKNR
jgi:hypothetical protein